MTPSCKPPSVSQGRAVWERDGREVGGGGGQTHPNILTMAAQDHPVSDLKCKNCLMLGSGIESTGFGRDIYESFPVMPC